MNLQSLAERPFDLLLELEQRARAAIAAREGAPAAADEWVGIGFRIGAERFVTTRGDVREVLPVPEHVTRVPGREAVAPRHCEPSGSVAHGRGPEVVPRRRQRG